MLKRNKMLVAFMMAAVLCMSIGFAALTDELTATGTFSVNVVSEEGGEKTDLEKEFDAAVYFSAVNMPQEKIDYAGTAPDFSSADTISFTFAKNGENALSKLGDTVEIEATITNASEVQAVNLAVNSTVTTTKVGTEKIDDCVSITSELGATSIAKGGSTTLKITVKLEKIPDVNIENGSFTIQVDATPAV